MKNDKIKVKRRIYMARCSWKKILCSLFIGISLMLPVFASPATPSVSADVAVKMLMDGNRRFVTEQYAPHALGQARRTELAKGQHPFAVVISCSDSRVPPELIFDQGLGELFVIRVAGNVLDAIELGSVEYAVEHLGAKLIIVLGHENCGAVRATVDGGEAPPNVQAIIDKIKPAVASAKANHPENIVAAAEDANISNMVDYLKKDPLLAQGKDLKILGAKYYLDAGKVEWVH
jgi:carbonic anhydrase